MAKAKKLASGNWRCLVFSHYENVLQPDGTVRQKRKYESFTAPTKREAEFSAAQFLLNKNVLVKDNYNDYTVYELVDKYINVKEQVLSPTTINAYHSICSSLFRDINQLKIKELTTDKIQLWISIISIGKSAKTIKNAYGLLTATLKMFCPAMSFNVKLPQKEEKRLYVPTDNDICNLIEYLKKNDRNLLVAVYLAAYGTLRRSEICALTTDDVDGNVIHINKAMVQVNNNGKIEWIIKKTKNPTSTRDVVYPDFVIEALPKKGRLYNNTPAMLTKNFINIRGKINIPYFRFHDLRHYSASVMHAIGVPDQYIMKRGGWASDYTLKNVYRGSMDDFELKFTEITNKHFASMQHEMQHENQNPL